jgi:CheY-like chemotaxis protein
VSADNRQPKVLVVDDEPIIVKIWRRILESIGCEVIAADSGFTAVEALKVHDVDFVITDLKMPKYDGHFLLDYLNVRFGRGLFPVFVCSGYIEDGNNWKRKHDVLRIISKPFSANKERDYFRDFIASR